MTAAEYTETSILARLVTLDLSTAATDNVIEAHGNRISSLLQSISDMDERLDAIEGNDIESIESRLTDLEGTVNDSDIEGMGSRLDDMESKLDDLPDLEDIQSDVSRHDDRLDEAEDRLEALADQNTDIENLKGEVATLREQNAWAMAAIHNLARIIGVSVPCIGMSVPVETPCIWDAPMCADALIEDGEAA